MTDDTQEPCYGTFSGPALLYFSDPNSDDEYEEYLETEKTISLADVEYPELVAVALPSYKKLAGFQYENKRQRRRRRHSDKKWVDQYMEDILLRQLSGRCSVVIEDGIFKIEFSTEINKEKEQ